MSDILASMSVVLGADITEFRQAMASAKAELKGLVAFGEGLKDVGESMSKYLTLPLVLAGVEAVRAFDKHAQAIAQVENGLRSTGNTAKQTSEGLQALASQIQKKSVYGDEEVLQKVTTQLLTFSNISGDTFARTQQAAVDLSAKLGQDLQTSAIQLGKALNDPTQSLGALRRAGISFSNDQIALIHSLQETGQLGKAQTLILGELERQYGGTAEAAAKAGTGGLKQLSNQFGDLLEDFGKIILQGIAPLIEKLKSLVTYFQELSGPTKQTIVVVGALVAGLGPLLLAIGTAITLLPLLSAAFAVLGGPITLVVAAVALAAYEIYQHWDQLVAYFTTGEGGTLFAGVTQAASDFVEAVKSAFATLAANSGGSLGSLLSLGKVLKFLFEELAVGIKAFLDVFTGVINAVVGLLTGDFDGALNGAKQAIDGLTAPLREMFGLIDHKPATDNSLYVLSKNATEFTGFIPALSANIKALNTVTAGASEATTQLAETFSKAGAAAAKKLAAELAKLSEELRTNTLLAANLPATFQKGDGAYDAVGERIKILTAGLKALVADGLSPASAAFQKYLRELLTLEQGKDKKLASPQLAPVAVPQAKIAATLADTNPDIARILGKEYANHPISVPFRLTPLKTDYTTDIANELNNLKKGFDSNAASAIVFGKTFDQLAANAGSVTTAMQNLLKAGVSPLDPVFLKLGADFKKATREMAADAANLADIVKGNLANAFASLGDAIGGALGSGASVLQAIFGSLLKVVADFMKQYGEKLVLLGLADFAIGNVGKGTLEIAAGTALFAGAAIASSVGGAPSANSSFTPNGSGGGASSAAAQPIRVIAEFVLRGKDLVAIGREQGYRSSRVG